MPFNRKFYSKNISQTLKQGRCLFTTRDFSMNMLNACILESQKAAKITACFSFSWCCISLILTWEINIQAMQLERVSMRIVIVGVCDMYTSLYQNWCESYIYFLKLSNCDGLKSSKKSRENLLRFKIRMWIQKWFLHHCASLGVVRL